MRSHTQIHTYTPAALVHASLIKSGVQLLMCVLKEAETEFVNSYDPAAVLFNLNCGTIPHVRL